MGDLVLQDGQYIALGFPMNGLRMVPSHAVIAFDSDGTAQSNYYSMTGKSSSAVQPIQEPKLDLNEAFVENGKIFIHFQRDQVVSGTLDIKPGKLNIIYAEGRTPSSPTTVGYHRGRWQTSVTLLENGGGEVAPPPAGGVAPEAIFIAHGVMMLLAWAVFSPMAISLARVLRGKDPMWFQVHRGLQMFAVVVAFVAWVMMLVRGSRTKTTHLAIGSTVMALAIVQVAYATFLRPAKGADRRAMWTLIHRFLGSVILILAIINCFIGIDILDYVS